MQCVQVQSNAQSTHVTLIHVHSNFATTHNVYDNFVGVRSNFAPSSQQLCFRFVKYEILSVPTVMPVLYVSVAILSRLQNSVQDRLPWRIHWLNLGGGVALQLDWSQAVNDVQKKLVTLKKQEVCLGTRGFPASICHLIQKSSNKRWKR